MLKALERFEERLNMLDNTDLLLLSTSSIDILFITGPVIFIRALLMKNATDTINIEGGVAIKSKNGIDAI